MSSLTNKDKYGEVFTPPELVEEMHDLLFCQETQDIIENMNIQKIFEPGAGQGIFFDVFQNKNKAFSNNDFYYVMNEINNEHEEVLYNVVKNYKSQTNIIINDVFNIELSENEKESYDLVLGNLPFTGNTKKFVPGISNKSISGQLKNKINPNAFADVETKNSVTLWTSMTHYLFQNIIKPSGLYFCIIPCIWLKPDRSHIYDLFTKENTILFLKIYNCASANKIFKYKCQTPICYVLLQKKTPLLNSYCEFGLYNLQESCYNKFRLYYNKCIPTNYVREFSIHNEYITKMYDKNKGPEKYNMQTMHDILIKISCLKHSIMNEKVRDVSSGELINEKISHNEYKIITGANYIKPTIDNWHGNLTLNGFICKKPGLYYKQKKLILAHKRLPVFYKDYNGDYGLMGRDMYVFLCDTNEELDKLYNYFNLHWVKNMITYGFRVRMNFIEKYPFEYLPNVLCEDFDMEEYQELINIKLK